MLPVFSRLLRAVRRVPLRREAHFEVQYVFNNNNLGCNSGNILKSLAENGGIGGIKELYMHDPCEKMLYRDQEYWEEWRKAAQLDNIVPAVGPIDGSRLPYDDHSFDIVVSSMSMHWVNDLPNFLKEVKRILKPDGVFMAAMLGGETLHELRSSFVAAELERDGGVSPHASPMVMMSDAGNLLSAAGFAIPTIDTDQFTVGYASPALLFDHLRNMGESNAALGMRNGSRLDLMLAASAAYVGLHGLPFAVNMNKEKSDDELDEWGEVPATFEVVFLIGWAPAPTQPKPLARGSVPKGFGQRGKGPTDEAMQ